MTVGGDGDAGGVNGLSTACHLAAAGAGRVVLVERSHLGASGKSGALVRTQYSNEPETRLAYESLKVFAHWDDAIGGGCGFDPVGLIVLVPSRLRPHLEANVAMHRCVGVRTGMVSAADVASLDLAVWCGDTDAIAYEPESGYADPNLTAYALAASTYAATASDSASDTGNFMAADVSRYVIISRLGHPRESRLWTPMKCRAGAA